MTIGTAKANPTKAFFVKIITRDITLTDCIFDLIDNSVDGAWRLEGSQPMGLSLETDLSKYKIEVEADADHFRIADNCGGITFDDAAEYAFTFGRGEDDAPDKYSIGVYGIGMKRAVFKIGSNIKIRSTYVGPKGPEAFVVPINVPEWMSPERKNWDFDIEADEPLPQPGVEIDITDLDEQILPSFNDPAFIQNLRRTIGRDYALHLRRGLKILVNGEDVKGWEIELRESDNFAPLRTRYEDDEEGKKVVVEILAGMAAPPPEDAGAESPIDGETRSGWYVVCNGRIVLSADKSIVSGWGSDDWPRWHPQYAGFIGLIFFSSETASALPLTTTKRSIDGTSNVFRRAMPRMRDVSKKWIAYTNARKQTLDDARKLEAEAKPKSIYAVSESREVRLPVLAKKSSIPSGTISYAMPISRIKSLADEFGNINMSYREVGMKSFEHAFSDLVGND
jgi:hypothetical protein